MSLIDGLILHTLNEGKQETGKYALLMEFYALDAEIADWYSNKSYKERFRSLELHFKQVRARAILYALGII